MQPVASTSDDNLPTIAVLTDTSEVEHSVAHIAPHFEYEVHCSEEVDLTAVVSMTATPEGIVHSKRSQTVAVTESSSCVKNRTLSGDMSDSRSRSDERCDVVHDDNNSSKQLHMLSPETISKDGVVGTHKTIGENIVQVCVDIDVLFTSDNR